jgi:long-chain acyl-CoA synthetase
MKSADLLLAAWQETLIRKGDAAAIFDTNHATLRSFQQIEERALSYHPKLSAFDTGSVVAVQIGNHEDWPSIFLACLQREMVVLPLEHSVSKQACEAALTICQAVAVIAPVPGGDSSEISVRRRAVATTQTHSNWGAQVPSLLKLTSGTTAVPRAIRFRSEQLLADCENICATMEITGADLNFGVIPMSHSYGFSNLITPLIARGVPMVLTGDRLPRAVLNDLARSKATVFPGTPLFYQAFCEMDEGPRLPNLRLCISAGAPLTAAVARNFREQFKQPIHSFYGSSECGGICYDREGTSFEDGLVGSPMSNVDVEFIEPAAEASQIRVRSAAVGDGYFPEPDEERLRTGVFVPDDLLARHGSGLKIVGRISDVINVAGKKVNPAEVEAQLLQFAGVREAIVFGRKSSRRNEEVAACVVAAPTVRESELLTFCRTRMSAWQVPKQIFFLDEIPVNERGKTSRRELGLRFAQS